MISANLQKNISVFLPAYNEESAIGRLILDIDKYLKSRFFDYEILVISEGSTDKTNSVISSLQKEIPRLKLLTKEKSYGYAGALRTGFQSSTKDLLFYMDGDGQFDIRELDKLLPLIEKFDVVTGYKIKRNDALMRIWMSALYNLTMRLLFGLKVKDVNCAFKLYKKKVIDDVNFLPNLTQGVINAEVYISAVRNGYTIGEVAINHFPRFGGYASSEFGLKNNVIALVRPRVIVGFIKDTILLWQKTHKKP